MSDASTEAVDLTGRRAWVIGGTSGIGRTLAAAFQASGASVLVSGTDPGRIAATADELGPAATVVGCDITDDDLVGSMVASAIDAGGVPDVVVLSAALGPHTASRHGTRVWDAPVETWRRMWATNVDGAYHVLRHLAPSLAERGRGVVIGIGSGWAARPKANNLYGVTKGAFRDLLLSAAADLEPTGVTVNLVNPGTAVDSGFHRHKPPEERDALADPSIVVPPVLWLASGSAGVTGTEITARGWTRP